MTKRISSLFVCIVLLVTSIPLSPFPSYATDSNGNIVDFDIFRAQYLTGCADYAEGDVDEQCHSLYNYYLHGEFASSSRTFLDNAYDSFWFNNSYKSWKAISYLIEPSSAFGRVMTEVNYYETVVFSVYLNALGKDGEIRRKLEDQVFMTSKNITTAMCDIGNIYSTDGLNLYDPTAIDLLTTAVESTLPAEIVTNVLTDIDLLVNGAIDFANLINSISTYNAMSNLDEISKEWFKQMSAACDGSTPTSLKIALQNLSHASLGFKEATEVGARKGLLTTLEVGLDFSIQTAMDAFANSNVFFTSVWIGLKLGKAVSNIFFATDDVCEQFSIMEKIYEVQDVAKRVVLTNETNFKNNHSRENALAFIFAFDTFFESVTNIELDCIVKLLDKLYNGGFVKMLANGIMCIFGIASDYQDVLHGFDSQKAKRISDYHYMTRLTEIGFSFQHPISYNYYFVREEIPITGIRFSIESSLPPEYNKDYADMIEGGFISPYITYLPSNTTQTAYVMTSDNPDIIKVNDCMLSAISPGTANITITSLENPELSYTAPVEVGARSEEHEALYLEIGLTYTVNEEDEATITGLQPGNTRSNIYIPSYISGYRVTAIARNAFNGCSTIKRVSMADSIETIHEYAFHGCSSLTDVTLSNNIPEIQGYTFDSCTKLKSIKLPYGVTAIWACAFNCCYELKAIDIPDSVTRIGRSAFDRCYALESIYIPDSVTTLDSMAFQYCSSLTNVYIGRGVKDLYYSTFWNCTALREVTLPATLLCINPSTFNGSRTVDILRVMGTKKQWNSIPIYYGNESITNAKHIYFFPSDTESSTAVYGKYNGTEADVVIPEKIDNKTVTKIEADAFLGDTIVTVTVPRTVTSISEGTFDGCTALEEIIYKGEVLPPPIDDLADLTTNVDASFDSNHRLIVDFTESSDETTILSFTAWKSGSYYLFTEGDSLDCIWIYDEEGNMINDGYADKLSTTAENIKATINCEAGKNYYIVTRSIKSVTTATSTEFVINYTSKYFGDATSDDYVSIKDILVLRKYLSNLLTFEDISYIASDINGDGLVNSIDILTIRKYLVAAIGSFPIENK